MSQVKRLNMMMLTVIVSFLAACGVSAVQEIDTNNLQKSSPKVEELEKESENVTQVRIKTSHGDVVVTLYNETPKHRENFIKLVNDSFYDNTLFHRVIKDFMIQGGDPNSKGAAAGIALGEGGPGYTIEAEIQNNLYHKKGALCAARQGDNVNPEKSSSGSQFYVVTGKVYQKPELEQMEVQQNRQKENGLMQAFIQAPENSAYMARLQEAQVMGNDAAKRADAEAAITVLTEEIKPLALASFVPFKFTEEQLKDYTTNGGTPFLDNAYTVFGEVIKGMEVINKIGTIATAPGDRPLEDVVVLSMEIIK
jgi:cyclophilin family peptidyl-prolyl cis-trans isomerase